MAPPTAGAGKRQNFASAMIQVHSGRASANFRHSPPGPELCTVPDHEQGLLIGLPASLQEQRTILLHRIALMVGGVFGLRRSL